MSFRGQRLNECDFNTCRPKHVCLVVFPPFYKFKVAIYLGVFWLIVLSHGFFDYDLSYEKCKNDMILYDMIWYDMIW